MAWQDIGKRVQARLLDSIPEAWRVPTSKMPPSERLDVTAFAADSGLLTAKEITITASLATDIVGKIANGTWNSEEVTRAFCKRAAIAHQMVNCFLTIYLIDHRADHIS